MTRAAQRMRTSRTATAMMRACCRERTRCLLPCKPAWCDIRTTVFSWTGTRFPLHIRSAREVTINRALIITVLGKAFSIWATLPKINQTGELNQPGYAGREIHPVMALRVVQQRVASRRERDALNQDSLQRGDASPAQSSQPAPPTHVSKQ